MEIGRDFDEELFGETKDKQRKELPTFIPQIHNSMWYLDATEDIEEQISRLKFAADFFYRKREYTSALQNYHFCLEKLNGNGVLQREVMESMSRCYAFLGEKDKALDYSTKAVQHASNFEQVTMAVKLHCFLYRKFEMLPEYLYWLKKLSIIHPGDYRVWLDIAEAYQHIYARLIGTGNHEEKQKYEIVEKDIVESTFSCDCVKSDEEFELLSCDAVTSQNNPGKLPEEGVKSQEISAALGQEAVTLQERPDKLSQDIINTKESSENLDHNAAKSEDNSTVLSQQAEGSTKGKGDTTKGTIPKHVADADTRCGDNKTELVHCCEKCGLLKQMTFYYRAQLVLRGEYNAVASFVRNRNVDLQKEVREILKEKLEFIPEAVSKWCFNHVSNETYNNEEDIVAVGDKYLLSQVNSSHKVFEQKWFSWLYGDLVKR